MEVDNIHEQQRKNWLIKIMLLCGHFNRCKRCGCRLPGKRCFLKENLNSEDIDSMKALYKKMKGGT